MFKDWYKTLLLGLLLISVAYFTSTPINLTTADLGRHIKNGEVTLSGESQVFGKNLYSYSYPDADFTNHHWGSGVIFYLIHQSAGFIGLSVFFVVLSVLTFWLFFDVAVRRSNFYTAFVVAIVLFPTVVYRTEIRPEVFSYLFMGIFAWILNKHFESKKYSKLMYLLIPTTLVWINLHIYFFFSFLILAVFGIESFIKWLVKKDKESAENWKSLVLVGLGCLIVSFVNPFGWKGVLAPLEINQNYGYRVLENQNLFFLKRVVNNPVIVYFELALGVLILSWITFIVVKFKLKGIRDDLLKGNLISNLLFSLIFSYLGWMMLRNVTISALFFLPVIAGSLKDIKSLKTESNIPEKGKLWLLPVVVVMVIILLVVSPNYWEYRMSGVGLMPGIEQGARFFKTNGLKGPVFNNYDIGGYLIYELYPAEKVFVDNRPEAYPEAFFKEVYVPMQEDEAKWREVDAQYNFNSIFFYRHDLTPWAQKFLVAKVKDPEWAPVFVDNYIIILLKRNEQNRELIEKFELPKEMFKVSTN